MLRSEITLKCPNCKNLMNYKGMENSKKRVKVCVFCGKSFQINSENTSSKTIDEMANYKLDFSSKFKQK